MNLIFLATGLLLHGSPAAYARAISEATRGCSGIILQFPIYAGIMGILKASGLVALFADGIVSVASEATFGPMTFLSAGVVNVFVPSGGGQWAIQGPIVLESAMALGVAPGKAILAFSYGDAWTNMLQPFWALPLLAITRLKARELIGYTGALMLLIAPVYIIALMTMGGQVSTPPPSASAAILQPSLACCITPKEAQRRDSATRVGVGVEGELSEPVCTRAKRVAQLDDDSMVAQASARILGALAERDGGAEPCRPPPIPAGVAGAG